MRRETFVRFTDRYEAGVLLAKALNKYSDKNVVVYGLPRGGVKVALEVARFLQAPLDLIIARKIGHPVFPEYAIAATSENGPVIKAEYDLTTINKKWFTDEVGRQRQEAKRRRENYLASKPEIPVKGKIAILVDDGIATGLTIRAAVLALKHRQPEKIIIAVPVAPRSFCHLIENEVDEIIVLECPEDRNYLGSVGAYYNDFLPVEDQEVIACLNAYEKEYY